MTRTRWLWRLAIVLVALGGVAAAPGGRAAPQAAKGPSPSYSVYLPLVVEPMLVYLPSLLNTPAVPQGTSDFLAVRILGPSRNSHQ